MELFMNYESQYLLFYDVLNCYSQTQDVHLKYENSLQLSIIQDKRTEEYRMVIDALHSTCVNELFMDYLATLFCYHDALNGDSDELSLTGIIYDYYMIPRSSSNAQIKTQKKSNSIFKPLKKIINDSFCEHFVNEAKLDAIHNFFDNKNEFQTFKLYQKFFFFDGFETNLNEVFDLTKIKSIREKLFFEKHMISKKTLSKPNKEHKI
jgi:hypothetical protein